MAEFAKRYADNTPGRYYVDEGCIFCEACSEIAPDNFGHSPEEDHDRVYMQPRNAREEQLCQEALELCPVEAIGSDGSTV